MSGASIKILGYVLCYDSGVIPNGAAVDTGILDLSHYGNMMFMLENRSPTISRHWTGVWVRDDGSEVASTLITANKEVLAGAIGIGSIAYLNTYQRFRIRVSAEGTDSCRVLVKTLHR